jgi:DNA-binding NarL/FixJ family response regulator
MLERSGLVWTDKYPSPTRVGLSPDGDGLRSAPVRADRSRVRAIIADSAPLSRAGLVRLLDQAGIEVVGDTGDAKDLLSLATARQPDVVIADVQMRPRYFDEGLHTARELRQRSPDTAVVLVSHRVHDFSIERHYTVADFLSTRSSGVAFLFKDQLTEIPLLIEILHHVADGGAVLAPEVIERLLIDRRSEPIKQLSPRELQVLERIAKGSSNAAISEALKIGESTVAKHINSIFSKLEIIDDDRVHRRVKAVLRFLDQHRVQGAALSFPEF